MEINVSQLLQEPVGSTREYKIDEAADIIGDGKEYRVQGECRLLRTRRGILVKCALDSEVELTCGRCLSRFRHPLKISFEEEFLPTIDVTSGMPLPQTEDAGAFMIDERHITGFNGAGPPVRPDGHPDEAALPSRTAPVSARSAAKTSTRGIAAARPGR